jgi:hypothetical protein
MFNKNVFTQKDPIADLVKPMLEAKTQAKMEELKGNQKVLDKNKNNKLDAQDFKMLRGEKKAVKEDSEKVEEGWEDMLRASRERSGPQPSGGSGIKQGSRYGGSKQKEKPEHDDADDKKKKVKEDIEQVDEASYSAKAAAAGKDIGKPGKMFKKIAKGAAARYGSTETGKKVAGAVLAKLRKEETDYEPLLIDQIVEDTMSAIERLDELKKSTVKSYIGKKMEKMAKKPAETKEKAKKDMDALQGAHERNVGAKLTSEGVEQLEERALSAGETAEKERIVKGMKKDTAGFKARYGDRAKSVMYATATKAAKEE